MFFSLLIEYMAEKRCKKKTYIYFQEDAVHKLEGIQVGLETILSCFHVCVCQGSSGRNFRFAISFFIFGFLKYTPVLF